MNKNRQFKINWFNINKFIALTVVLSLMIGETSYASNEKNENQPYNVAQLMNQKRVTLNINNKPLRYILDEIKTQSGIGFVLNDDTLDENLKNMSIKVSNVTVKEALDLLLKNTGYESAITNNVITIVKKKNIQKPESQSTKKITVKGRVVDGEDHKSITGATIIVKGTSVGAISDVEGNFIFEAEPGQTIEISFMGMQPQEAIIVAGKDFTVVMKKDAMALDDVVVTGHNDIKRSSYTGNAVVVKRDELLKASKTNVIKALQTFDPSFRIKENNRWGSDPNALPEMYIRGESGVGTKQLDKSDQLSKSNLKENPNLPTFIMDGFEISASTLYDFDPNRIESVTILKDAAATALYGARAANGVVVITTVAPKPGKLNIAYNFVGDITFPDLSDYDLLNAREKLELERESGFYKPFDAFTPQYDLTKEYYNKLGNINEGVETYWLSKPLETVFNHKHSLYVDGGSETLRFGIDLQYANQDGVMIGSRRDKVSAGLNLQYIYKTLTIKNQVNYRITNSDESPYGSFAYFSEQLPYDKYTDANGRYLETLTRWGTGSGSNKMNPLYEPSLHNFNKTRDEELINNLSVNWKILPELLLKGQLSLTKMMNKNDNFFDPLSKNTRNIDHLSNENMSSGTYYLTNNDDFQLDFNAHLSFNKNIKKNSINALLGINVRDGINSSRSDTYIGFPSGILSSPMYAKEMYEKGRFNENKQRMVGFLGTVNYSYDDTYMLDASVRVDGSSAFGSDKRFAPFWSFGAGINIHKYQFIKNLGFVDQFKIRGSYGQTGKANFPAYAARTSYEVLNDEWYKTGYGAVLKGLGNKNLKWETTNKFDIGAEFSLFNNRIYLKGSYYNELTVDLINDVTIPSSTGFRTYRDNVGEVSNKGYEFDFRAEVIRRKDMNLILNANLAHNKNTIEKISESLRAYNERVKAKYKESFLWNTASSEALSTPYLQYEEGGSMNSLWAVRSLGINPADGSEVLMGRNGLLAKTWEPSDLVVVGSTDPKIRGAFGLNFTYKQFSFYTSFMYECGGQRYNQTLVDKVENVNVYTNNVDRRVTDERWKNPGDIAKYKAISSDRTGVRPTKPSSRFVQDYNSLSWSSIELSYDLSTEVTKKLSMSMVRFTVGMNDLMHLSSVKMERGLDYPFARTINFSAKISF